jgi:hypothetical protein
MDKYGTWPTFANSTTTTSPLFHHLHLTEERANRSAATGKPEAYYFRSN